MVDISELRILVVEDHGFQRFVVSTIFEGLGARQVLLASDGQAALELFRASDDPIDVIVSDLDMPGMDGMEFIRRVAGECPGIALIILSGMERKLIASVESMASAYGVNLLGAIQKPANARKIEEALRVFVHGPAAPRPRPKLEVSLDEIAGGLRRDEFEPFYQPKVDLATGSVRGAEALARWRHPQHGVLLPKHFVPALEESGRIDQLTFEIAQKAMSACSQWSGTGLAATVSINISLRSLSDVSLADRVIALAGSQSVDPRRVILEITESAEASGFGSALENLSRLRMRGFGLSIDDYGTGYSTMERLVHVPFTELKIDRAFLTNALNRPSSRAALESSLELAQKLGIVAVAEGVETPEEWELLRELGCALAQGYFVARPMPLDEFLRWAVEWKLPPLRSASGGLPRRT